MLWLEMGAQEFVLIGRDLRGLERVACDFKVRSPNISVDLRVADLTRPQEVDAEVRSICKNSLPDLILIAQGLMPNQIECQSNLLLVEHIMKINALSPILWAESFASNLDISIDTTLAVIGSVAGDRARKSNYVYGSTKAFVASYIEGLQHRFAGTRISVVLIKPGPTDTPMTRGLKNIKLNLANVDSVAKNIVRGIKSKRNVIYTPAKWALVMWIVKRIPQVVFNKMDF